MEKPPPPKPALDPEVVSGLRKALQVRLFELSDFVQSEFVRLEERLASGKLGDPTATTTSANPASSTNTVGATATDVIFGGEGSLSHNGSLGRFSEAGAGGPPSPSSLASPALEAATPAAGAGPGGVPGLPSRSRSVGEATRSRVDSLNSDLPATGYTPSGPSRISTSSYIDGSPSDPRGSAGSMVDNRVSIMYADCSSQSSNEGPEHNTSHQKSRGRKATKLDQVLSILDGHNHERRASRSWSIKRFFDSFWSERHVKLLVLDTVIGGLIVLNAFEVGISEDLQADWSGWLVADAAFAIIFTLDLLIKIWFAGWHEFWFGNDRGWNFIEATLVVFGLVEIAVVALSNDDSDGTNFTLVRVLRLFRVTRLLRVCRLKVLDELKVMITGALGGIKTLCWATLLICLPLYVVAIFYKGMLSPFAAKGQGAELFVDVPTSFFTLFRCIVSTECSDLSGRPIFALVSRAYGWGYGLFFCVVQLLMAFGLFNVIVAIFIENVLAGARTNDQLMKRERLRDQHFFAQKMTQLVAIIVEVARQNAMTSEEMNGDMKSLASLSSEVPQSAQKLLLEASDLVITPAILDEVRRRPGVNDIFHDLALADEDTLNLFETLDSNGSGAIDMGELFDGIAKLRGAPCRSDVVALNVMLQKFQSEFKEFEEAISNSSDRQIRYLRYLKGRSKPQAPTVEPSPLGTAVV